MAKIKATKNASKKEVIAHKAAYLFRVKGFKASSMRELADLIGVEAPSLYNHIGSKNELLNAICFSIANEFTDHLTKIEKETSASVKKLEQIIRFHINIILKKFDEVFVVNHEWKHLQEPFLSNFLNQRKSYEKRLIAIVEKGIKQKEIKNIEPKLIIFTILSAVRGLELWHRNKKLMDDKKLEHSMIAQLTTGFINN